MPPSALSDRGASPFFTVSVCPSLLVVLSCWQAGHWVCLHPCALVFCCQLTTSVGFLCTWPRLGGWQWLVGSCFQVRCPHASCLRGLRDRLVLPWPSVMLTCPQLSTGKLPASAAALSEQAGYQLSCVHIKHVCHFSPNVVPGASVF